MSNPNDIQHSSFRDPAGFLFYEDKRIYRQINKEYKSNYDLLLSSGLYQDLVDKNLLVSHKEVSNVLAKSSKSYLIIEPECIPFISYPYEWCFTQYKLAALATLNILKISLDYNMILKDASAYNIQFENGKPIFIDTLSFEKYDEGKPWVAYNQFCKHFLAPLVLMSRVDVGLNSLMQLHIDGIPLDLTSKLLPFSSKFNFSVFIHIFLHSRAQKKFSSKNIAIESKRKISRHSIYGLIDSLKSAVQSCTLKASSTVWSSYYADTNYSENAKKEKVNIISEFLDKIKPKTVWDLGANDGFFSRLCSSRKIHTLSFDFDALCVEKNYNQVIKDKDLYLLPLVLDLNNPSSGIGWNNKERQSIFDRKSANLILGLALIHHLAIANNVPLKQISAFFANLCKYLIIEFVLKDDSQVQRMLAGRDDVFADYNIENFEKSFLEYFTIKEKIHVADTKRYLYLMEKNV